MSDGEADATPPAPTRPLLSIVRGEPTLEQLAALIAVVSARAGAGEDAEPPRPSLWATPRLRTPLVRGPGAWRASGLPG